MPNYRSPGLYFEEPQSSPTLVTAAPTDVGAMLGAATKGPPNRPVRITSLDQFFRAFGTYFTGSYLAHGARQFFENGGTALWVSRVIGASGSVVAARQLSNTTPSSTILLGAFSVGSHGNLLSCDVDRVNPVVGALATSLGTGAVTSAVLSDVRQLYVGATINILNTTNLRVTITGIDPTSKTVFFPSRAPSGAITAAGSTVTLEEFSITVLRQGVVSETIPAVGGMAMDPTAGNKYFKNVINNNDPFREIVVTTDNLLANSNTVDPRPANDTVPVLFAAGADGTAVAEADIVGTVGPPGTGYFAFDSVNEASMLAAPGWSTAVSNAGLINYLEARLSTKMWGIIDAPSGLTPAGAITYVQSTAQLFSANVSIYYPWIQQVDPTFPGTPSVQNLFPPSGAVMGMAARTASKFGVQRAPAGTEKGRLTNVTTVERKLLQADTDILNPAGINAILALDGKGVCVMGARTLAKGDFLYVNVRRVFNYIEASLKQSYDVILFEENDERTRSWIERGITSFLNQEWRNRRLKGKTASAAFTVKCNEDNNPASTQAAGQLFTDIGLAVANPAEFVIFRLFRDQREAQAELAAAGL